MTDIGAIADLRISVSLQIKLQSNILNKLRLNRLQMVQFEYHRPSNLCVSLRLVEFHFPIFSLPLSGVIRIGLPSIKM